MSNPTACKSYTIHGTNGVDLVLSETPSRESIVVTIEKAHVRSGEVILDAVMFKALCQMDSAYDGLEVINRAAMPNSFEVTDDSRDDEHPSA